MYGRPETPRGRLVEEVEVLVRRMTVEAEQLAHVFADRHGLHGTDFQALIRVMDAEGRGKPLTPGELGAALRLSSGATTAVVDRLERQGHLRRDRDDADRRKVHLRYAERGMAVALEFFGPLGARNAELMTAYSDADLEVVRRFLAGMGDLFADYRDAVATEPPPGA